MDASDPKPRTVAANPARGQLNREINISLSAFAPENLVSRDGFFGSPVPRQPAPLHTQAESGAYLRDSSRVSHKAFNERSHNHCLSQLDFSILSPLSSHFLLFCGRSGTRQMAKWRSPERNEIVAVVVAETQGTGGRTHTHMLIGLYI